MLIYTLLYLEKRYRKVLIEVLGTYGRVWQYVQEKLLLEFSYDFVLMLAISESMMAYKYVVILCNYCVLCLTSRNNNN